MFTVHRPFFGASLALLDNVYFPLFLPRDATIRIVGYGMPRVGNPAFSDYVESHVDVTHINNREDPVRTIPGRKLGFRHPSGEKHIQAITHDWSASEMSTLIPGVLPEMLRMLSKEWFQIVNINRTFEA